jgi:membrane protease YdiL (CAAX protease family)
LHRRNRRRGGSSFGHFAASGDDAGRLCGSDLGAATLDLVDATPARARPVLSAPEGLLAALGPGLLLIGALVPSLRPFVALAVVAGWALQALVDRQRALAWAAALPLAVVLTWPWVLGADVPVGDPACRDVLSAIALRRIAVAVVGLAIVGLLAVVHRSGRRELGLARPGRREGLIALGGCLVLVAGGLVIGPAIARPFFGDLDYPVPLGALVPAVLFGLANGVLEEVLYRGALQAWLARLAPLGWVILFQGLVFGIVHAGPEVLALLPVHILLLTSVGIAAGLARWKLGSLWVPIGIHVGADIALYVGLACRAPA